MGLNQVMSSISKWAGKQTIGDWANYGVSAYFGFDSFVESRREGSSMPGAMTRAVADTALPLLLTIPGYLGLEAVTSLPSLGIDAYKWQRDYRRYLGAEQRQRAFQTMAFQDNQQTYTMRQAAMGIAQRSRYNMQQAMMGNEAQFMMK